MPLRSSSFPPFLAIIWYCRAISPFQSGAGLRRMSQLFVAAHVKDDHGMSVVCRCDVRMIKSFSQFSKVKPVRPADYLVPLFQRCLCRGQDLPEIP